MGIEPMSEGWEDLAGSSVAEETNELTTNHSETRVGLETQLSRKCNANFGKSRQKCGKQQRRKEKAGCVNLPQLADPVR